MKIYISGPMTGKPDWNMPYFNKTAEVLRALGYMVVNPAEINQDTALTWKECLREDLRELLECDAIVMLDGWEDSNGAHLEMYIAHRVGIKVIQLKEAIANAPSR